MQRKFGVIFGYLNFIVQNLSTFFLTPLMIFIWGQSDFGIYKLIVTLTGFFMLLDLGISNSVVKFISEYKEKKQKEKEGDFLALIILIYSAILLILIFSSIVLSNFFEKIYTQYTSDQIELITNLFFLLIINAALVLFFNIFQSLLRAYEKHVSLNIIIFSKNIFRFLIMYLMLSEGSGIYNIVLIDIFMNVLLGISLMIYIAKKLSISIRFKGIDKKYIKYILSYSLFIFIEMIAFQLFWSTDLILLSFFTTANAIAVYSIGTFFTTAIESMSGIVSRVTLPRIVSIVSQRNSMKSQNTLLEEEIVKISRIKMFILFLPLTAFIFLGEDLIILWVGEDFKEAYLVALVVIIPQVIARIQDGLSQLLWAKNKQKQKAAISIFAALVNVLVTIILIPHIGILGAAIGTGIAFVIGYILGEGIYITLKLKINVVGLYIKIYKSMITPFILICLLTYYAGYGALNWVNMGMKIMAVTIIYCVLTWLLAMNPSEKKMVLSIIRRLSKII